MVKIYKENETIYLEDGDEIMECTKIVHDKKTDKDWVILPENSANRKCIVLDKVTEEPLELSYKESRTIGPRGPKKDWREYLDENERFELDQYEEGIARLKTIADENRRAEKETPKSEIEKLKDKIAKYQSIIAKLEEAGK